MESKPDQGIDTDLYSRQIGTFGIETMGKLIKMQVVIVGVRGLGVEVAKNLILAGPKSVSLFDPALTEMRDLGSNFYTEEKHVGKVSRAEACLEKLKELNPYVTVNVIKDEAALNTAITSGQAHVVCQTLSNFMIDGNNKFFDQQAMDAQCRANKVGYICSEIHGPWGYAFVDYGVDHTITDGDGEATKQFIVTMIEKGAQTVVTVHEDKLLSYQEGDFVNLREVEGMTEINDVPPIKVLSVKINFKTNVYSMTLDLDSTGFGDYTRQGVVENTKVAKKVTYHSWEQSYVNPSASAEFGMMMPPDLAKFGRSEQLHCALMGIQEFTKKNGCLPIDGNQDECKELATALMKANVEKDPSAHNFDIEDGVFKTAVSYCGRSISPMAAFFGGIVAQEIVKYTGKYSPLKQWLHFDIYETLPREDGINRATTGGRYDDQIAIYGQAMQDKLSKVNLFMVGAGALGCELIKAFALMGIGCSADGAVHCTDNDNIEVSNLNRQFLFRKNNVGHSKSECACAIAKQMNPDLNVKDYMTLVAPSTEEMFNDKFWEKLDFVVNAVDNIKARLYVDQRCVWYEKPLLESGTLGTKANSQMVVPHVTQCYGESQDPPEEGIPMCTLRNFPNQIEHCIEWGREKFNDLFVDTPGDLVTYLADPKAYIGEMRKDSTTSGIIEKLEKMEHFIEIKKANTFETCVALAKDTFNSFFDHYIRDLLAIFPPDAKDKDGQAFWSGPKRCPSPVTFDTTNETHVNFVLSYANLFAFALSIPENRDVAAVTTMAAAAQAKPYVPKKIKVVTPEEEKENAEQAQAQPNPQPVEEEGDDEKLETLSKKLDSLTAGMKKEEIQPAEFEKDDDKNFHIDFINACSNLRASNYQITNCDRGKTKMIAGKIIPAIATTTAMITGAVTAEIYKFVQGYTKLEDVKNSFINLALPTFLFSEPAEVKKIKGQEYDYITMCGTKCIPENQTIFSKIVIDEGKSLTIKEFIAYMDTKYGVEVSMITAGQAGIYTSFPPGKNADRLDKSIESICKEIIEEPLIAGRNYYQLGMLAAVKGEDDLDAQMPPIKYVFPL